LSDPFSFLTDSLFHFLRWVQVFTSGAIMHKSFIIAVGAVAAFSIPVLAAHHAGHNDKGPEIGRMTTSGPMTRAEVEARVKTGFAAADANADGFIVAAEDDAMRTQHRAEMRDADFAAIDSNHDGSISRAEFDAGHQYAGPAGEGRHGKMRRGHRGHNGKMGAGMGERRFEHADANADGKVSLGEALAQSLARFDAADTKKDGTLSLEERKTARETMRAKWRDWRS
jgi:EF hand